MTPVRRSSRIRSQITSPWQMREVEETLTLTHISYVVWTALVGLVKCSSDLQCGCYYSTPLPNCLVHICNVVWTDFPGIDWMISSWFRVFLLKYSSSSSFIICFAFSISIFTQTTISVCCKQIFVKWWFINTQVWDWVIYNNWCTRELGPILPITPPIKMYVTMIFFKNLISDMPVAVYTS